MFKIPQNNQISTPNTSDLVGNIFYTKNINLNDEGYIKLAPATVSIFNNSDDADYDTAQAINAGNRELWVLSDDSFSTSALGLDLVSSLTNQTNANGAPTPGVEEDLEFFNDNWVITDNGVKYDDSGSWTAISGTPASSSGPNVLARFPYQNGLLVGNGNEVALVDTNWQVVTTLVLPTGYVVLTMWAVGSYAYIGTINEQGVYGALFRWNGSGTAHNGMWSVKSLAIESVTGYKDSVACYTRDGELLYFTGNGFQRLATFPFYNRRIRQGDQNNQYSNVTHRGMVADEDLIYIAFGDRIDGGYFQGNPSGVWCYNPGVGLYHIYSGTKTRFIEITVTSGNVNTSTDTMTTASSLTMPDTGTQVFVASSGVTGVSENNWYYLIKVSSTEFRLARTYDDSVNGVPVDITAATTTTLLHFPQKLDYGDSHLSSRIALAILSSDTKRSASQIGEVVFSVDAQNASDLSTYELCVPHSKLENRGYFVTPKLQAKGHEEKFKNIALKFNELIENDKIVIKYRTETKKYLPNSYIGENVGINNVRATWTSDTAFTTSADLHELSAGDEIEIIGGAGSGTLNHVESVSESAGTYTVTLTEANPLVSAGNYSYFFADNWKMMTELDSTLGLTSWKGSFDTGKSGWIQFKIELQGRETTINELIV